MCVQDIKLGMATKFEPLSASGLAGVNTLLVRRNAGRKTLIVSMSDALLYTATASAYTPKYTKVGLLRTVGGTDVVVPLAMLSTYKPTCVLKLEDIGAILTEDIYVQRDLAAFSVVAWEISLRMSLDDAIK